MPVRLLKVDSDRGGTLHRHPTTPNHEVGARDVRVQGRQVHFRFGDGGR
jgi:hypothetical protein